MKVSYACLALGLFAATHVLPAEAGDFNTGAPGYRGPRAAGTMVPAPVPIPETFSWYLRADIGLGLPHQPSVSEVGRLYGRDPAGNLEALSTFGSSASWFQSDFDTFLTGGVGVGYYITPRIRADVTLDARTEGEVSSSGSYMYVRHDHTAVPPAPIGEVYGEVRERIAVRSTVGLFNAYYDLTERGRFTPYIGAGIGFAVHDVERSYTNTERVFDTTVTPAVMTGTRFATARDKTHGVAFAGMLTTGVAWTLWQSTVLDLNYRYLYLGSTSTSVDVYGAASKLTIGDQHEHQLRAGLRWNVW
ncbi:MAG TPA: P44/Msp2 family outer membrane protein [Hyphomicrobiaceae bacterium]|nr:P44/Msp2 family outer membrane protein [Hyphomicrobiaceae bacterium]